MLASAAPPVVGGKKPGKRPAWDLKGQLCDLNAELKRYREKIQTLDQENQQLRDQLKEAQQQAKTLGMERSTLEGELARVQAQAEQGQQELGSLSTRVLELEERLGTQEGLVQELQKEQLELQEERRALATRLKEQEVGIKFSQGPAPPFLTQVMLPHLPGSPEITLGLEPIFSNMPVSSSWLHSSHC
jgi:kinesin family protein C1